MQVSSTQALLRTIVHDAMEEYVANSCVCGYHHSKDLTFYRAMGSWNMVA